MITNRQRITAGNLFIDLGKYYLTALPVGVVLGKDLIYPIALVFALFFGISFIIIGFMILKDAVN